VAKANLDLGDAGRKDGVMTVHHLESGRGGVGRGRPAPPGGPAPGRTASGTGAAGGPAAAIFLVAAAASVVLDRLEPGVYRFLLGDLHPVLVTATAALLGWLALRWLTTVGWFDAGAPDGRTVAFAAAFGAALTAPVIVVDLLGGFPPGMNVGFPASLLFYPSIAVVAESTFHLVPLALAATAWKRTRLERSHALLFGMAVAALVEPVLQVAWGSETSPTWANAYVGFHLLVFNVAALAMFRRWGFIALCAFRVGYYAIWHVLWGHLRLSLLFG
jgi:hypothetical protein